MLWMCRPTVSAAVDLRLYDDMAGCFEVLADVLALLNLMHDEPELQAGEFPRSLELLAEAQSALRAIVAKIDGRAEVDQVRVFNWLKATTMENHIFVERYMRADDPADPTAWADLSSRIEAVDARVQETLRRIKKRRKLLGKVRHKLQLIERAPDDAREHWRILATTVDGLVRDGLPPSNRELRDLLAPAFEVTPTWKISHGAFSWCSASLTVSWHRRPRRTRRQCSGHRPRSKQPSICSKVDRWC